MSGCWRGRRVACLVTVGAVLASLASGPLIAAAQGDLDLLAWRAGTPRADLEEQLRAEGHRPIARGPDGLLLVTPSSAMCSHDS